MKKTMKLESLNDSKFEAFKGMEVKNPLLVVGGAYRSTECDVYVNGNFEGCHSDKIFWNCDQYDMSGYNYDYAHAGGSKADFVLDAFGPGPGATPPGLSYDNVITIGQDML